MYLILGRHSMLAHALVLEMEAQDIPYRLMSYAEIRDVGYEALQGCHALFNCIAYTAVDRAEVEIEEARAINVDFVRWLAVGAKEKGAKLIHYSTDYLFDGNSELMYDETASPAPLNVYGRTKWEGEQQLFQICDTALVVRTSWLYGPGKNNFVQAILRQLMENETVRVVNDQWGRTTYTRDLARATLECIDQSGVMHFANNGAMSRFEWAEAIADHAYKLKLIDRPKRIIPVSSDEFECAAKRPMRSVLSTTLYEKWTGCSPRMYDEALCEYLCGLESEKEIYAQ